jgi:hypothetical protein
MWCESELLRPPFFGSRTRDSSVIMGELGDSESDNLVGRSILATCPNVHNVFLDTVF